MSGTNLQWNKTNKIYDLFNTDHLYIQTKFIKQFRNRIVELLIDKKLVNKKFTNLENLHNEILNKDLINYEFESGVNGITKLFYDVDDKLINIYINFLTELHKKLKFDFYFQQTPTIRFHCPNAKNSEHYPRYHNDCLYGHPPQEINIWMSLTKNKTTGLDLIGFDKSKQWMSEYNFDINKFTKLAIESKKFNEKGNRLSTQIDSTLKHVLLFDSLCIHTNQPRKNNSRVSIDVRINPVEKFEKGYVGVGRMKAEFKPGGKFGYNKKSIKEII